MLLENSGEVTPERMKRQSHSKNNTQLWMWLVIEVKSGAVKSNISSHRKTLNNKIKNTRTIDRETAEKGNA